MQVVFPKHVWLHTECMPTSHWRTGASHISLRVIAVAWWISSKQITDPLPTSLSYYCCYCCYLSCAAAAATTVATAVTCLDLLLLLLLLSLATIATCYSCHYCCSLPLLLLVTLLLHVTLLIHLPLTGIDNFCRRGNEGTIDTIGRNSLPSTDLFLAPLLSYHFATDTLLADTNLSRVVELTTQLLILESILSPPNW